jgi:hypothetical protein
MDFAFVSAAELAKQGMPRQNRRERTQYSVLG